MSSKEGPSESEDAKSALQMANTANNDLVSPRGTSAITHGQVLKERMKIRKQVSRNNDQRRESDRQSNAASMQKARENKERREME